MGPPIGTQLAVFALTVGIGLLLGLLFDCYRVARGRLRPGALATLLGDLLFWLVALIVTFALLVVGNWGELRLYVWVGFLLGAFGYRLLLSRRVVRLLLGVAVVCERVIGGLLGQIWRLLRLPGELKRRFFRRTRLGQALQRWWKWLRTPTPPKPTDPPPPPEPPPTLPGP